MGNFLCDEFGWFCHKKQSMYHGYPSKNVLSYLKTLREERFLLNTKEEKNERNRSERQRRRNRNNSNRNNSNNKSNRTKKNKKI